tara:strand:- start:6269 stop:6592 length:324 start_codon:yes stop_codon:yes gene_type:complete
MENEIRNNSGISEPSFEVILNVFKDFPEIESAVLFGSRALGTFKKGSDIDIAIYGPNLTPQTSLSISSKLNESTPIPYYIDIVAPKFLDSTSLIEHIKRVGKIIYTA